MGINMTECRICNIWYPLDSKSCPMCELKAYYVKMSDRCWRLMTRIEKLISDKENTLLGGPQ
jgi:hypothetical protein